MSGTTLNDRAPLPEPDRKPARLAPRTTHSCGSRVFWWSPTTPPAGTGWACLKCTPPPGYTANGIRHGLDFQLLST